MLFLQLVIMVSRVVNIFIHDHSNYRIFFLVLLISNLEAKILDFVFQVKCDYVFYGRMLKTLGKETRVHGLGKVFWIQKLAINIFVIEFVRQCVFLQNLHKLPIKFSLSWFHHVLKLWKNPSKRYRSFWKQTFQSIATYQHQLLITLFSTYDLKKKKTLNWVFKKDSTQITIIFHR